MAKKQATGSPQAGTPGLGRESKAQIAKPLNKYYVEDVRMIYDLVSELLLRNPDFLFALEEYDEGQDEQSIYKGYNGYEAPVGRSGGGEGIHLCRRRLSVYPRIFSGLALCGHAAGVHGLLCSPCRRDSAARCRAR